MPTAGPVRIVVLQPTPFCNIDCSYCYLGSRDDRRRMSMEVVDAVAAHVLCHPLAAPEISVIWHAGEPTVVPPAWYEEAFTRLQRGAPGRRLSHSFQTNAVALNDDWIALWRRWNVRVGVSIDGPREINDLARRTRRGGGSFERAHAGMRRLRDARYPFHVITVLTAASLDRADDLYDFYRAEGIGHVCFNVEEREGAHEVVSFDGQAASAYRRFLDRYLARMQADRDAPRCREVDGVLGLIMGSAETRRGNSQVHPLELVSVAVDGGLSTYSPEFLGVPAPEFNDFTFGNVLHDPVDRILTHPAFLRLRADIEAGIDACAAQCPYFGLCGGGAPANKYFEHGTCRSAETLFCKMTRQTVIEAVLTTLEGQGMRQPQ